MLLFPADVLRPRRVDDHFAPEAEAARELAIPYAVVDHDALVSGAADAAVARVPAGDGAVYRGWMLTSAAYAGFERALAARGTTLRTTATAYRTAHELPGWHRALAPLTPAAEWTTDDDRTSFADACRRLGPGAAVLRDHTKSLKHHWDEACHVPSTEDQDAAWRVAARFRELRGDDFAGGFVLRRFESFTGAELRTWWRDGGCRLVGPHPDTPTDRPAGDPDLTALTPLVAALALPFVTVDLARRDDGEWRVIELGDGQVSDRPATMPATDLIAGAAA